MSRRSLSLVWELEELEQAVDAARVLCDASSQDQYATEHDARIAPRVTSAVLTLVGQRLGLICRVIRGYVPIEALAGGHNVVEGKQRHADGRDVLLAMGPRGPKKKS
jgi:hypothetical protein